MLRNFLAARTLDNPATRNIVAIPKRIQRTAKSISVAPALPLPLPGWSSPVPGPSSPSRLHPTANIMLSAVTVKSCFWPIMDGPLFLVEQQELRQHTAKTPRDLAPSEYESGGIKGTLPGRRIACDNEQ